MIIQLVIPQFLQFWIDDSDQTEPVGPSIRSVS